MLTSHVGTRLSVCPTSPRRKQKIGCFIISGLAVFCCLLITTHYGHFFPGTRTQPNRLVPHPKPTQKSLSGKGNETCTSDKLHAGCVNNYDVFLLSPPSKDSTKFSVISASTPSKSGYNYVFYLPLTVRAWGRLGFGTLVILIGTLSEWTARPPLFHILTEVVRLKAAVVFVKGPRGSAVMLSQTCRLFAHNIFNTLSDDVHLITSDTDLWPFRDEIYVPPKGVKVIRSTFSNCCGHFKYRNMTVRMLPLSTVEMTVKLWKEVMNVSDSKSANPSQQILDYFVRAFGKSAHGRAHPGNSVWYMDQKIISIRIKMWAKINGDEKVEYINRNTRRDRIDRIAWVIPKSLKSYNDTHLPRNAYQPKNWNKIRPLLNLMYDKSEVLRYDTYSREFLRLVGQTN